MKPSNLELAAALAEAESMRESDEDPSSVAMSLLYLYRRNAVLESLLEHVELFLKFGLPAEEHKRLVKLLDEIERMERHETGEDERRLGL